MHVDFFIAGVQKGGTTALDAMLRRHPDIQMASEKEPHFFDNDSLDWSTPDYNMLHRFYGSASHARMRGEATPIYTYWPGALERLKAYNSSAKLIIMLRHPVWRAFSQWRMQVARASEQLAFSIAIRDGRRRVAEAPGGVHRLYSYVERSYYAPQVRRVISLFPRTHVSFHRTDALWRQPGLTLNALLKFLDALPAPLGRQAEYIVPLQSCSSVTMAQSDHRYLSDLYADDIEQTAVLTGLDLSDWLSDGYVEPMSACARLSQR